jgi:hypothetical protein
VPALLIYENKEPLGTYRKPGGAFRSAGGGMSLELSAQMANRKQNDERLLTHQGLMLDGLRAIVHLLDVSRPEDLFNAHKTSLAYALYHLPEERAPFVHDMVKLVSYVFEISHLQLQCHERHFDFFKVVTSCDVYMDDTEKWEPIVADRLGKIGPHVHELQRIRARL